MKAFKEWQRLLHYNSSGAYENRKQGWKAALRWIKNDICPEAWDVGDIEFDIKKELNSE